MTSPSSTHRNALCAFALVAGIVVAPAACTLDLQGKTTEGAGGSSATSTSSSTSTSGSSTSSGSGTGGVMTVCMPDGISACYDGPAGTENIGTCKSGQSTCSHDGMTPGECMNALKPRFDDCLTPEDEDCDGKVPGCTGDPLNAGSVGGGSGDDVIFAVASDTAGNVFLGGVSGAIDKGTYYPGSGAAVISKLDKAGAILWSKTYPVTTGVTPFAVVRGVAVDALGNVTFIGEYQGKIAANGVTLVSTSNSIDVFVIKLDPGGSPLWSRSFGKDGDQLSSSISADADGNMFVSGYSSPGTINIGPGDLMVKSSFEAFVAKLEPTKGDPLWGKLFGEGGLSIAWHVAATPDKNVVVTGQFSTDIDFGGGALTSAGGKDIFLAKLTGDKGQNLWANQFGDFYDQMGFGVAVDSQNNVVMVGRVQGTTNFGGADLVSAGGNADAFVAHFTPAGVHQWSARFGDGIFDQVANSVAVDPADNVLVTGMFRGTFSINAASLAEAQGSFGNDVFVAKLRGADGLSGWARRFGDSNDQVGWAITSDPLGNPLAVGTFAGTIDFTPPAGLSFMAQSNTYDAFWVRLAP